MADGKYTNSAGLFKNTRREKDTHPHFKGTMELDSELVASLYSAVSQGKPAKIDLSLWTGSKTKNGDGYLKLAASKAWESTGQGRAPARQAAPVGATDDDESDLPF